MSVSYQIGGVTAASGTQYVLIQHEDRNFCIEIAQFVTDEKGVKLKLSRNGISIIGRGNWSKFLDRVTALTDYPSGEVIEKTGWNGQAFASPAGEVKAPKGHNHFKAIEDRSRKCQQSGSLKAWRKYVARPLANQRLASFILMASFAPALLELSERQGNFGFEVVGKKGCGKSTLLSLAASACGGVTQSGHGHYWVTLDTTINALEDSMRDHADSILIMDEANLLAADQTPKMRSEIFKALAFKLGSGTVKTRHGAEAERDYRLVFLISSNEPLSTMLGTSHESARAAADRLITLPIADEHRHGVFDSIPKSFGDGSSMAKGLMAAADQNHGLAMPAFIENLVMYRSQDEAALKEQISQSLMRFRDRARVDPNDGSAVRVADAFGLVFAAGKLAKKFGVLPNNFKPIQAALHCHDVYLNHIAESTLMPFTERLKDFAASKNVVKMGTPETVSKSALGYVKARQNRKELWISPKDIEQVFPDWLQIKNSPAVRKALQQDGSHKTCKRKVEGKKVRMHVFRLPDLSS